MMYHRRSKLELSLNILSAVRDGVDKPTRIMYAARMSWKPLQRILSQLVEQRLLELKTNTENRQSNKLYLITEKGNNVIDYFEKAKEILTI